MRVNVVFSTVQFAAPPVRGAFKVCREYLEKQLKGWEKIWEGPGGGATRRAGWGEDQGAALLYSYEGRTCIFYSNSTSLAQAEHRTDVYGADPKRLLCFCATGAACDAHREDAFVSSSLTWNKEALTAAFILLCFFDTRSHLGIFNAKHSAFMRTLRGTGC